MISLHELHPNTQRIVKRVLFESATSAMGQSSTIHGTGAIDSYDPKLNRAPLKKFKEVTTSAFRANRANKVRLGSMSPVIVNPTMKQVQTDTNDDDYVESDKKKEKGRIGKKN